MSLDQITEGLFDMIAANVDQLNRNWDHTPNKSRAEKFKWLSELAKIKNRLAQLDNTNPFKVIN